MRAVACGGVIPSHGPQLRPGWLSGIVPPSKTLLHSPLGRRCHGRPYPLQRTRRRPRPARPAQAAGRGGALPVPDHRRRRLRPADHGRARRARHRRFRSLWLRRGPRRDARQGLADKPAEEDGSHTPSPPHGRQSGLGRGPHGGALEGQCRPRLCGSARLLHRRSQAPPAGGHRLLQGHRALWPALRARQRHHPDPLQRRRPRHGRLRHCPRRRQGSLRALQGHQGHRPSCRAPGSPPGSSPRTASR